MRCTPSIRDLYERRGKTTSGMVCDLYFDADDDPATGSAVAYGPAPERQGYERRAWVPLGVSLKVSTSNPQTPEYDYHVSYLLHRPNEAGELKGTVRGARNEFSDEAGSLIAHGDDGIEMAIPLAELGLRPGQAVRLLMQEWGANDCDEARYTVKPEPR